VLFLWGRCLFNPSIRMKHASFFWGGGLLGPRSLVVTCTTPHLYDKKKSHAALLFFHSENYVLTSFYVSSSRALFDGCNFFYLGLSFGLNFSECIDAVSPPPIIM
jgi:hypothetical protein